MIGHTLGCRVYLVHGVVCTRRPTHAIAGRRGVADRRRDGTRRDHRFRRAVSSHAGETAGRINRRGSLTLNLVRGRRWIGRDRLASRLGGH